MDLGAGQQPDQGECTFLLSGGSCQGARDEVGSWGGASCPHSAPEFLLAPRACAQGRNCPFSLLFSIWATLTQPQRPAHRDPNDLEPEWPFKGLPPPATVDSCRLMENSNNICS